MLFRQASQPRSVGVFTAVAALLLSAFALSVPADEAVATQPASPADGAKAPRLHPDVRALPARDLSIVRNAASRRTIRFESGLANTGRGVLEVRPNDGDACRANERHATQIMFRDRNRNGWFNRKIDTGLARHSAGCMVFHPTHDHWHFEAAARYALWHPRRDTPIVVKGRKMSFCLRDSEQVPQRWATRDYAEHFGACSQRTRQGISIGWVDVYQANLPGQFLTLPRNLADGLYCLRTTVDPRGLLVEADETNNSSVRSMRIRDDRVSSKPFKRCKRVL